MQVQRPGNGEYGSFYEGYVKRVGDEDVLQVLAQQPRELSDLLQNARDESYRYADGKWSLRQLVGHLSDGERVFAYRLLCVARGDQASLPGFDENEYMDAAPFERVPLAELLDEFRMLREANLQMMRRMTADDWARVGTANDTRVSARALAFIIAGHARHHMAVLRERYAAGLKG